MNVCSRPWKRTLPHIAPKISLLEQLLQGNLPGYLRMHKSGPRAWRKRANCSIRGRFAGRSTKARSVQIAH